MSSSGTRILSRREIYSSPWIRLIEKNVQFAGAERTEIYHNLDLSDYVTVIARTPGGLIPIVYQYRPAVEKYTWELPAGLRENGEDPEKTCRRELLEETGLKAESIRHLGAFYADTGRLNVPLHAYYVEASEPDPDFVPKEEIKVRFVTEEELKNLIFSGEFRLISHIAVFLLLGLCEAHNLEKREI